MSNKKGAANGRASEKASTSSLANRRGILRHVQENYLCNGIRNLSKLRATQGLDKILQIAPEMVQS
jgi:hypothetical protein